MINFGFTTSLLFNMSNKPSNYKFLDPFMGGGGMVLEALDMQYECHGIELFYWAGLCARANIKDFENKMLKKFLPWNVISADSQ